MYEANVEHEDALKQLNLNVFSLVAARNLFITDAKSEKEIKDWLRYALDWCGGRELCEERKCKNCLKL